MDQFSRLDIYLIKSFVFNQLIYLDSIENVDYFNGIEKVLSSIGVFISDTLFNFFNSDGIENKDVCMIILINISIFYLF
jgi:hypothetical protein